MTAEGQRTPGPAPCWEKCIFHRQMPGLRDISLRTPRAEAALCAGGDWGAEVQDLSPARPGWWQGALAAGAGVVVTAPRCQGGGGGGGGVMTNLPFCRKKGSGTSWEGAEWVVHGEAGLIGAACAHRLEAERTEELELCGSIRGTCRREARALGPAGFPVPQDSVNRGCDRSRGCSRLRAPPGSGCGESEHSGDCFP